MIVEPAGLKHLNSWSQLRHAFWPDASATEHALDVQSTFFADAKAVAAFIAVDGEKVIGFAEASLRNDYVNGCETSPVAFLEGIYVNPSNRRQGTARALCLAVEEWGRKAGCLEFASDTSPDNSASQMLHRALGFHETERVVFFKKPISAPLV